MALEDFTIDGYIPEDSEIQQDGRSKSWRLANGKFVRGEETPEKSGNYPEEKTSFTGIIQRVGIQEGSYQKETKGGAKVTRPIHRLEIDLKTRTGVETIAWSLLDTDDNMDPKTGTVRLAWALAHLNGNEITVGKDNFELSPAMPVMMESWKGDDWEDDKGKARSGSTYVSLYALTPILDAENKPTGKFNRTKLMRPKIEDGSSRLDQWHAIEPALRALPYYKEREMKGSDTKADTHLAVLCKEVEAKGWPTPEQAPTEWLGMAAAYFEHDPKPALGSYSDDEWGEIRQVLQGATAMPAALDSAKARIAGAAPKGNAKAFG